MTTQTEALKLALEALKSINEMVDYEGNGFKLEYEIKVLEEALAKQEQGEPVAWMYESVCGNDFTTRNKPPTYAKNIRPLYTTPQQRKPLTDDEIDVAWRSVDYTVPYEQFRLDVARAIEAAHGIKAA